LYSTLQQLIDFAQQPFTDIRSDVELELILSTTCLIALTLQPQTDR
jgi:hypothetical protein